jgi:hypothetical protein
MIKSRLLISEAEKGRRAGRRIEGLMPRDFFPRQEAKILLWTANFAQRINSDPGAFGLSDAQAAHYLATQEAFASAFALAMNPQTATTPARAGKNSARVALEAETRMLARIIRATPNVTAVMRIGLGFGEAASGKGTPTPSPADAPQLQIDSVRGRWVNVRLSETGSGVRRKPDGVAGALFFTFAGEEPPASINAWSLAEQTSTTLTTIRFGSELSAGTRVWIVACWYSPRGQRGPMSAAVCTWLQGGVAASQGGIRRAA